MRSYKDRWRELEGYMLRGRLERLAWEYARVVGRPPTSKDPLVQIREILEKEYPDEYSWGP